MDTSILTLIILGLLLFSAFNILKEYERGVIFLLGRFWKVKGPGLIIVVPGIQKMIEGKPPHSSYGCPPSRYNY